MGAVQLVLKRNLHYPQFRVFREAGVINATVLLILAKKGDVIIYSFLMSGKKVIYKK